MKIQDMNALLGGRDISLTANRFGIVNEDGKVLYYLNLLDNGSLAIECGGIARFGEVSLDDRLQIDSFSHDRLNVFRPVVA